MPAVVAVAGPAGAGKSTLVRALAASLGDASAIHVDDYQRVTQRPLREIVAWLERGADFDELAIPLLSDHLARLKQGQPVVEPLSLREIRPARHVLFETHFGRAHRDTGRHVDFLIWLDTPLDVALARNVLDLLQPMVDVPGVEPTRERVRRLHGHVEAYLAHVRRLVLLQGERVAADADLVIDGGGDLGAAVERARAAILARLP